MDIDSVQARIAHESAELRAGYPHITDCHTLLVQWDEAGRKRYALRLDIRWPQHQTLLSGEPRDDALAAIAAGFASARTPLQQAAWASR
jgi:hypothetical protein